MKSYFRQGMTWLFVPAGLILAYVLNNNDNAYLVVVLVLLYGMVTTFLSFFMAIGNMRPRYEEQEKAMQELRSRYQDALDYQLLSSRKALLFLTRRAMTKAAAKLVENLLRNSENDEQYDAAVVSATAIVEDELDEICRLVGIQIVDKDSRDD